MIQSHENLVSFLQYSGVLKSPELIQAFSKVDRAHFVPSKFYEYAYEDTPLPIGNNQTISQPSTVAFMLELLRPKKGDRILDLGSGSGWTTALLADIVGSTGKIYGAELIPELYKLGKSNVVKAGIPNAEMLLADPEVLGLPSHAPFNKILVSAQGSEVPSELLEQLTGNGAVVIPIRNSLFKFQRLPKGELEAQEFPGFAFVPLR